MFAWFKKRLRKEQIKLATQNALAFRYLLDNRLNAVAAGLRPAPEFETIEEMNLNTSRGHLEALKYDFFLPDFLAADALQMNKTCRAWYDEVLVGRKAFANQFGSASERILPFDQMFVPNEGWEIYLAHFGTPKF